MSEQIENSSNNLIASSNGERSQENQTDQAGFYIYIYFLSFLIDFYLFNRF